MKVNRQVLNQYQMRLSVFTSNISQFVLDKHILGTLGAKITIVLLGIIGGTLMARELGPGGRGQVAAVLVYGTLLNWIFNFGLASANLYYLNKQPQAAAEILTNAIFIAMLTSIPVVLTGGAIVNLFFYKYPISVQHASWLYFLTVPLAIIADYLIMAQQALHLFQRSNLMAVGRQSIQVLLLAFLFITKLLSVTNTILAVTTANVVIALFALAWFKTNYWKGGKLDRELLKKCWWFGLKSHFGSLAQTSNRRLDQMLMVAMVSHIDLGLYTVATSISEGIGILPNSIAYVITPRIAQTEKSKGRLLFQRAFITSGIIVTLLVSLLIFEAKNILWALYGESFIGATNLLQILLVAAWFLSMGDVLASALIGLGHPSKGTIGDTAALIATISLLVLLVPRLGIVGAAQASLGAYIIRFTVMLFFHVSYRIDTRRVSRINNKWTVLNVWNK